MTIQRRDILLSTLPLSAALFLEKGLHAALDPQGEGDTSWFDQDTYNFWTSEVSRPSEEFAEHGRIVSHRSLNIPSEAEVLYYSKETGFLRTESTEADNSLVRKLLPKGEVSLLISLDTIRPSAEHMRKMWAQKNASLRFDLKQGVPWQPLSETLNWSAIAAMFPRAEPFSTYEEIAFDPKS